MSEFWQSLSINNSFAGSGYLTCDSCEQWECSFSIIQLLNGRIVVIIDDLKDQSTEQIKNKMRSAVFFSLVGKLKNAYELKATSIFNLSPRTGDSFEGFVVQPGCVEIKRPDYEDRFYSKNTYEVTNLSLGLTRSIETTVEGASIKIECLPQSDKIHQYAKAINSAEVGSQISLELSGEIPFSDSEELIGLLCELLTFSQRSFVHWVASHQKNEEGLTVKSVYREPFFNYPRASRPLIPATSLQYFLEVTTKTFYTKAQDWKLPWVINHYTQSMQLRDIISQSIGFFTALETIKSAYTLSRELMIYTNTM